MKVGIIGAGLAGLAAGLELADRGHQVEVLERRPWAGGATYSFLDEETGDEVDNGQHLFMECTSAYRAFLERLGTLELTYRQDRLHVSVFDPDGRRSDLWSSNLPLGLHLAPALLRYRHLSWRQKIEIARAFLALRLLQVHERGRLEQITFGQWLRERKQSPDTIREFWDFLVIPTLNCRADEAGAGQAIFVLEEGFQKDPRAAALAVPATGLSKLHVEPAIRAIEERGGTVSMRTAIECIRVEEGTRRVARPRRRRVPHLRRLRQRPCPLAPPPPPPRGRACRQALRRPRPLRAGPILNLHLWFDRPVADFHFASFIRSEVQWVFNRSRLGGEDESGRQHLVLSISAPGDLFALTQEQVCERVLPQLQRALPSAREAALVRYRVTKEPEATFLPAPGLARPGPRTPLPNLLLAGSYTDTGWPATMESAVRSGLAAATAVEASGA